MRLVFGEDRLIAAWAKDKFRSLPAWSHCIGVINDGLPVVILGAFVLHNLTASNVELDYWGPNTLRPRIVGALAHFCFRVLKVERVTCRTPRSNKIVARHLPKLGFRPEGLLRHYYGPLKRDDAIIFGLTKADAERLLRRA